MPRRRRSLSINKDDISKRIQDFYTIDLDDRSIDRDVRLQRYAKYRQWTEGRDYIGDQTSDAAIPDVMTQSLKVQDTLHNAVMSSRPIINAKAVSERDKAKQESIDEVQDYQFFVEQNGEKIIEEAAETFTNDGVLTIFIPWVKEERKVSEIRKLPPIPDGVEMETYFRDSISDNFKGLIEGSEWEYTVADGKEVTKISFYTTDTDVEMVVGRKITIFDAPKPIVKDYDEVLHPHRAANLQRPGPSNPNGASHVILIDYPTVDEIKALEKKGFYDLMTKEDLDALDVTPTDETDKESKIQKDDLQGTNESRITDVVSHKPLTRLTVFDSYDIDGDGLDEDVIWWYILETKTLLRGRYMTEMYPGTRRPFAEAQFLPVKGRRIGISLLEMVEGTHDMIKQQFDQTMDAGTITTTPYGFYRASGSIKQEAMRLYAGELYPLADPKNDIYFPPMPNSSQAFGFNMMTILNQMQEKLTTVGDLQLGRVPTGKATALRTNAGTQTILGQGEARPERILRRFFMGLTECWQQMYELNKVFLPEDKEYFVTKYQEVGASPYRQISKGEIKGDFKFDFKANILNTSKAGLQQALGAILQTYLNPIAIQMGLVTPDNMYRLLRDFGKSQGHDGDDYLTAPSPDSNKPRIMAEDAIATIMDGQVPFGIPAEGAAEHFQTLQEFQQGDDFGQLDPEEVPIFSLYMEDIAQLAQQEQQQLALQQASQGGQAQPQENQGSIDQGNQQVNENELINEELQQ